MLHTHILAVSNGKTPKMTTLPGESAPIGERQPTGARLQQERVNQPERVNGITDGGWKNKWAMRDSNPRHPRCKRGALAAELIARLSLSYRTQLRASRLIVRLSDF
jgi:hypothetical protein